MNVLAINGSPRIKGNTNIALNFVAKELEMEGIQTNILQLGTDVVKCCKACGVCGKTLDERCVIDDDIVNDAIQMMIKADAIIFASPVHFAGMSSNLKALMDRAFYVAGKNNGLFRHKVGGAIAVTRRSAGVVTFNALTNYMLFAEMLVPGGNYWNVVHGRDIGEVEQDVEGLQTLKTFAKNMAWVMKLIEHGKDILPAPKFEAKTPMNFIR